MKQILVLSVLFILFTPATNVQAAKPVLETLNIDSVSIQSNSRSDRQAARERVRVRGLTKELIERHTFEFDAFQYRFQTDAQRIDVRFRFYGSEFYSETGPKRDFSQSTKAPLMRAKRNSTNKFGINSIYSNLNMRFAALENFREEGQKLRFEVVGDTPNLSAHGFYRYTTKFEFIMDIFDGRMAMRIVYYDKPDDVEPVELGPAFYGYIVTLR